MNLEILPAVTIGVCIISTAVISFSAGRIWEQKHIRAARYRAMAEIEAAERELANERELMRKFVPALKQAITRAEHEYHVTQRARQGAGSEVRTAITQVVDAGVHRRH